MVEHLLAKEKAAGSNPVPRSIALIILTLFLNACADTDGDLISLAQENSSGLGTRAGANRSSDVGADPISQANFGRGGTKAMGTFRTMIEIGDQAGQRFETIEALVNTGATFTKVPRTLLESLDIPVDREYTAVLANGRRVPRQRGWATIRLEGQQFPTAVTFGEEGEPVLLGAIPLEHALLVVDPHGQRLVPVDALEASG